MKNQINMTEGAIFPKLVKFSVPLILSSILQLLFTAADIVVLGRYAGDNSLAAVGSTSSMVNLLVNFFIRASVGCSVVAANSLGAGNKEELNRSIHTTMVLSVIAGLILTVVGISLSRRILILMDSPEDVLPLSALYLKIYFSGITATIIYNFGAAMLKAKGDAKRPLYILLVAGIINVILNLIFVVFFKMDVAGVAFATVLGQTFAAFCIVWILLHEDEEFRLDLRKFRLDLPILKRIIKIGIPAGLQSMLFNFSNVMIQSAVNSFGSVMVAGTSAAQSIEEFVGISMGSLGYATLTFAGQNMGAQKFQRIKRLVVISEASVVVVGLVLGLGALAFGRTLLGIYSENPAVIDAGMLSLSVILVTCFMSGMMDTMTAAMRGIGHSVLPMVITLIGACVFRVVYLTTFFQIPRFHTYQCIFYSYPLSWGLTFAFLTVSFVLIMRKIERR
ncbi:MATE family efflux transporter [Treponema ruminis]|uniref:Putative MATE family efflux protein n=1 Tax=Treponema ruminis TaxID=744515 RepID=A0A7W8GA19_9SPIR|nr:MATE family efflux transporter [Treponema ruminis]MBB5226644.1 putative MATE family efflux protein [Treponema ruminis]QSI02127.1 MATE family efflux transporter [Treponema ruminis]